MRRRRTKRVGFTLIEMMIVVLVVSILATIGMQQYASAMATARRTEATIGLSRVWELQQAYYQRNLQFSTTLQGLGFTVPEGRILSTTRVSGRRYVYTLSQPWGLQSWYCTAVGNIDGDQWVDVVESGQFRPSINL